MSNPRTKQAKLARINTGYQKDLAYIHDVGFGGFAVQSAPGLLEILRNSGISEGRVVDLGCGSGLWARALCDAGYDVLGIDYSQEMIKIACARVPDAKFRCASWLEAKIPPCDAVTAIGEVFNYRFEASIPDEAQMQVFERVYRALRPGGLFLFDVAQPGRSGPGRKQKYFSTEDWDVFVEIEEDASEAQLTRHIVSYRRVGKLYRRSEEVHRLRLYRSKELLQQLRSLGFRAKPVRSYGEFRLLPGMVGIVART